MSVLMLSFLACAPSSVSLDDGLSEAEDADGDGIPDDQQEEDEPVIHFASGGWSGEMGLYVKEWDWDVYVDMSFEDIEENGLYNYDILTKRY